MSHPSCEHCDAEATVFVTAVSAGQVTTRAYCEAHAREEGLLDPHAFDLLPMEAPTPQTTELLAPRGKTCPNCGFSQREFEKRGRVGCATCYSTFGVEVRSMLPRIHAGTLHLGKLPRKALEAQAVGSRLKHYQSELQRAIAAEEFEAAARFRDKINETQALLTTGGESSRRS